MKKRQNHKLFEEESKNKMPSRIQYSHSHSIEVQSELNADGRRYSLLLFPYGTLREQRRYANPQGTQINLYLIRLENAIYFATPNDVGAVALW